MAVLGEIGKFPLHLYGFTSLLSFWHRSTQMPDNSLIKQALNLVSENDSFQSEWNATVKYLLSFLNMEEYYRYPYSINNAQFTAICTKKLQNKISEQWYSVISGSEGPLHNQSSKLRFYKLFKTSFHREPYLDFVSDFKLRRKITKFRCSDHALEIEVGRHRKLNVEDRLCKPFNVDVETELHFLQNTNTVLW